MTLPTFKNRIGCVSSTTGTSDLVLAATAVTGYRDRSNLVNSEIYNYSVRNSSGTVWEDGFGTWDSGTNTLTRGTVYDSSAGGTTKATLVGDSFVIVGNILAADIANIGATTGTFTPTPRMNGNASGITTSTCTGTYVRFADGHVLITANVTLTSKGSNTGLFTIDLPFAAVGNGGGDNPLTLQLGQLTFPSNAQCTAQAYAGTTTAYFYGGNINTGGGSALDNTAVANNTLVQVSGVYQG